MTDFPSKRRYFVCIFRIDFDAYPKNSQKISHVKTRQENVNLNRLEADWLTQTTMFVEDSKNRKKYWKFNYYKNASKIKSAYFLTILTRNLVHYLIVIVGWIILDLIFQTRYIETFMYHLRKWNTQHLYLSIMLFSNEIVTKYVDY